MICVIYIYNIYAFSSLTKCINHLNRQNRQRSFFVSPDKTRLVLLTTSLYWAALCSFFAIINVTNVLAFQSKILKKLFVRNYGHPYISRWRRFSFSWLTNSTSFCLWFHFDFLSTEKWNGKLKKIVVGLIFS